MTGLECQCYLSYCATLKYQPDFTHSCWLTSALQNKKLQKFNWETYELVDFFIRTAYHVVFNILSKRIKSINNKFQRNCEIKVSIKSDLKSVKLSYDFILLPLM